MGLIDAINSFRLFQVRIYSRLVRGEFAPGSGPFRLHPSVRINNPQHIFLAKGVNIGQGGWIYAITDDGAGGVCKPSIHIGEGTQLGAFLHLTAANSVHIGERVLAGQGILITDSNHAYEDIEKPVLHQGLKIKETVIGDGTWLGNHAVIVGAKIGKNCVIAANSIVTKDVPDYCVAAGAPARVIRRYDLERREWVRCP